MRKSLKATVATAVAAACTMAIPAMASSPHFISGPTYKATTTALTASGKAAGLDGAVTKAFLTAGEIDVFFQCRNHGQNFAPGHPATSTGVTGPSEDITPHNGQITFNVSLPAPVPSAAAECPNRNWTVVVTSVIYRNVVLHIQQNGVDLLTDGPHTFPAP
ncbi:MAG TPA: hypothetical protein VFJ50_01835 [Gemmatimonadales bacterium]|nr:hypothetical protein [Gemmatimonadales bacterium]